MTAGDDGSPLTILLAEDNGGDVYLVGKSLEKHGLPHRLVVANDGEEAIRLIDAIDAPGAVPDLVLLDLNLPKRSGREVVERLRSNPHCASVPVIVVSSSDSVAGRGNMEDLGVTAFFVKPAGLDDFMQLGELVKHILQA
jgi:CheY-like chemotaxis protein